VMGGRLRCNGGSLLAWECIGMEAVDRLRRCTSTVGRGAAHRRVRGSGGTGSVCCASLSYGFLQVSGEVEDKLAVHDHVVVRLLKVACEHLCVLSVLYIVPITRTYHHHPRPGRLPTLCGHL
jgi:hypothetical protein